MKRVTLTMLLLASGSVAAHGVTLRIADQKGNMRAELEAAQQLNDLSYRIEWAEFPAAAPLAEALNAGAVDAGIIGDAPLLFSLAAGSQVKAVAVSKSTPTGLAVLVAPDSPIKTPRDLRGKRIATGRGSIGHFIALKALESAGLSDKAVSWRFLTPADARIALASGSVDAWATWDPYTALAEVTHTGHVLINGVGLSSGNSFLAATDAALSDASKRAALQDYINRLAAADRWANRHVEAYSARLAKIIGFPQEAAAKSFARRQSHWQSIDDHTVQQQQETADFYQKYGLIAQPLDVKPTFYRGLQVAQQ
ncbi:ABC transporter substrate-binding protein [Pantoea dispersa]|uniref:ABC transporter substrate-binding protein n=1 Tax=Pantoea dispersa TaxID=59814 RepID=UPI001CA73CA8|nr:ABC transporter substrate-binding protein [Pantoea dispersa]QZY92037.1 ABC transporter substrate-binding protein [Pantoea dispersa]